MWAGTETARTNQHGVLGSLLEWWMERRSKAQTSTRQLRVVESLPLNSKQKLLLVDCAGQQFLVGVGLDEISSIVKVEFDRETIGREPLCD
jgi:flagellar biogenesis protein FliO